MNEKSGQEPPQSGGENVGVDEQVAGRGDEGRRSAEVTPDIARDAEPGQTETPAAADDVGVPPDEEIAQDEQEARDR